MEEITIKIIGGDKIKPEDYGKYFYMEFYSEDKTWYDIAYITDKGHIVAPKGTFTKNNVTDIFLLEELPKYEDVFNGTQIKHKEFLH